MTFWSPIVWGHLTIESHFHHPKKVSSRIARNASNELVKLNHFSEIWMNTFSDSNPPLREPPSVSLFQAPRNPSFALHQLLEFLAVRLPVKGSRWPFFEVFLAFIISGKWRFLGIPLQKNVIFCIGVVRLVKSTMSRPIFDGEFHMICKPYSTLLISSLHGPLAVPTTNRLKALPWSTTALMIVFRRIKGNLLIPYGGKKS